MLNRVILVGRLTADPQMRTTPSGLSNCRFSVAVDRPFVSKQTGQREADFINCVAWRQQADFIGRFFSKGSVIIVEGSLRNNNYTDNQGVKHYGMDVQVDSASFAGSKAETGGNSNSFNPNNSYGGNGGYSGGYNNGGGYNNNGGYSSNNSGNNNTYGGGNGGYDNSGSSESGNGGNTQTSQPKNDNNSDDGSGIDLGDLGDFEEIISDGEVPF